MTHTPGPWSVAQSGSLHVAVYPDDRRRNDPICFLGNGTDDTHKDFTNAQANASLIAAAPALLEALESIANISDDVDDRAAATCAIAVAKAAIALAKGETQ